MTIGVVILHARLYMGGAEGLHKHHGPVVRADELPEHIYIPKREIDPQDFRKLYQAARGTDPRKRPSIEIRVLRAWYEKTVQALGAFETGGEALRVEAVPPPESAGNLQVRQRRKLGHATTPQRRAVGASSSLLPKKKV